MMSMSMRFGLEDIRMFIEKEPSSHNHAIADAGTITIPFHRIRCRAVNSGLRVRGGCIQESNQWLGSKSIHDEAMYAMCVRGNLKRVVERDRDGPCISYCVVV